MIKRKFFTAVILIAAQSVFANSLPDSYGFGARWIGMSGAGVAFVNDWTATYYNTAGLAAPPLLFRKRKNAIRGAEKGKIVLKKDGSAGAGNTNSGREQPVHQVGLGFVHQASLMNIKLDGGDANAQNNATKATSGLAYGMINTGFQIDLRSMFNTPYDVPIRMGIALALNADGSVSKVTDLSQKFYDFRRLGRNPQRISLFMGLGAQIWKNRLSIGFGLNNLARGKGEVSITNINLDPNDPAQNNSKIDVKGFPAPMAGLQYRHPIDNKSTFSVGFNWRSQIYLQTDLNVTAELQALGITSTQVTQIKTSYSPHVFVLGFGYIRNKYKFALDFEYQTWSGYSLSSTRKLFENAPEYRNIFIVRLGADAPLDFWKFKALPMRGRVGYAFVPSFTKDQTGDSNYLDNTKHLISYGLSYVVNKNSIARQKTTIDFGMQFQVWAQRSTVKIINDPFQPNYSYGGVVIITSLSASKRI